MQAARTPGNANFLNIFFLLGERHPQGADQLRKGYTADVTQLLQRGLFYAALGRPQRVEFPVHHHPSDFFPPSFGDNILDIPAVSAHT
jgi:hypothetical protein